MLSIVFGMKIGMRKHLINDITITNTFTDNPLLSSLQFRSKHHSSMYTKLTVLNKDTNKVCDILSCYPYSYLPINLQFWVLFACYFFKQRYEKIIFKVFCCLHCGGLCLFVFQEKVIFQVQTLGFMLVFFIYGHTACSGILIIHVL